MKYYIYKNKETGKYLDALRFEKSSMKEWNLQMRLGKLDWIN